MTADPHSNLIYIPDLELYQLVVYQPDRDMAKLIPGDELALNTAPGKLCFYTVPGNPLLSLQFLQTKYPVPLPTALFFPIRAAVRLLR